MKKKTINSGYRPKSRLTLMVFLLFSCCGFLANHASAQVKNIVLVHGAFADGSGYEEVYRILKSHGYNVSVVPNPDTGIPDDVAATNRVLARLDGPCILAGHSYGGAIISIAGLSKKVAGLVYIAAFVPDPGHSLFDLLNSAPHDPLTGINPPDKFGFDWYDKAKFHTGFCADLPQAEADFMYDSQVPIANSAFLYKFKDVAWKTKPCWYIVASDDHSIPPVLERSMGKKTGGKVYEIKASHVVFISHAKEVATILETAAKSARIN
ncbi:alpha/beta hydrolase [Mucilaginibacter sp. BJC16-A38]|uniref:alpha/beta hydrolase n=1 Tax=Mucilaginibacter phenanthrenivorans TaxID=1234842 RepID=UPI0021575195|nr:alpha/beta hydrolase [Mucilaginibacter phenanthrenivorans]MCR8560328.1 alpha/beta hydrolase [Mucilaginibacter phenanthrenivorans]